MICSIDSSHRTVYTTLTHFFSSLVDRQTKLVERKQRQLTGFGAALAAFFFPREKVMVGAEKAAAELAKAITEAAAIFILKTGC